MVMDWEIWGYVGGCAAFLVLAILGALNFSWLSFPSALSVGVYALGTVLIAGFYFIGKKVKIPPFPLLWGALFLGALSLCLYPMYGPRGIIVAYLLLAALLAVVDGMPGKELAGLGIAAMVVNFFFNGIPLLEPAARTGYTALGALGLILLLLGINILADRRDKSLWWLFGVGVVLSTLGGYRSAVLLMVLSTLITLNFSKKIAWKRWILYGAALALIVAFLGQVNAFEGESNPYLLATRRAGFTYERFDQIVNTLSAQPGLWFEQEPRYVIGEQTLGEYKIINAGIYGFLWLDGGLLGLISGCVLIGLVLGHMRQNRGKIRPFYGMMWIYFLVSIDAGLDIVYLCGFLGALFAISWNVKT